MKPIPFITFGLLACSVILLPANVAYGLELSGDWEFASTYLGDTSHARLNLKVDGQHLTGKLNDLDLDGTIDGNQLVFTAKRAKGEHFADFKGTIQTDMLEGTEVVFGDMNITWTAVRPKTPPAAPKVHSFDPTQFHRVFSDSIAPVLHIFPGDTVQTWTVDAGGTDPKGVRRSPGGNPETGPFYVEGALPGDTLIVKLNRVRLNRDSAGSGDRIVSSALDPNYLADAKYDEHFDSSWVLDREKGVAHLKKPSKHLKNFAVKLRPMLGCVAVAPSAHQSFRTGFLGAYGGNMDYNQLQEGTTLYLPVFAPGALLFIGDGHAAQGDGELTGDALETSMEVEFTVTLQKGQATARPRAENGDYLMAFGIANSLPEAVQSATTELAKWLERDYQLEPNEAAIVLGTSMQYNIAELVDPLVHVVAKVRKDVLESLKQ